MSNELEYSIKLEYMEHSSHPAEVFHAMGDLIESMKRLDDALLDSLPYQVTSKIVLEAVETGSIITKLSTFLENIDDEALKELSIKKLIGSFLVRGKYKALQALANKDGITDAEELAVISKSIEEIGREELSAISIEPQISKVRLLQAFNTISESMKQLGVDEKAIYISSEGSAIINRGFTLSQEKIEELLIDKTSISVITEVVDIKKPDYLGNSRWDVYFPQFNKSQQVKIEDKKWLEKFQSGGVDLRPGDSIKATIESRAHLDEQSREIAIEHHAIKIHEVITNRDDDDQISFFSS